MSFSVHGIRKNTEFPEIIFYRDKIGEETLPPPISNIEVLLAVEKLKLYIEQSDNLQLNNDELKLLKNIKRRIKLIEFNSSKQTNLDSFLNI